MKLSFSTKGWHGRTFEELCQIAAELRYSGIELHNIHGTLFTDRDGAFHDYSKASTLRLLYNNRLTIPCIDTICDIADTAVAAKALDEAERCFDIAEFLHIPYIRVRALSHGNTDADIAAAETLIGSLLPRAQSSGVAILVETSGVYCDTGRLRETLNSFACDSLGALWNIPEAYSAEHDSEVIVRNLGAYIRHVHYSDVSEADGCCEHCIAGDGELPMQDIMLALRSINYDGAISLVWNPEWCEELDDIELILSQFASYMRQFGDPSRGEKAFYYNRAHTGRYVWRHDDLIDCTFSEVLDRMVEDFPDQYAFKYTTLDYTRTYSEFRDDVDTFARTLISLGVRAGDHVAVWASNVPQWYITFWATVKLGAVLVTVNTAYKIH